MIKEGGRRETDEESGEREFVWTGTGTGTETG